jgi:hypothetical protein
MYFSLDLDGKFAINRKNWWLTALDSTDDLNNKHHFKNSRATRNLMEIY